jgi:predicted RNase H-like nuclease (RuvC/YqgF family)
MPLITKPTIKDFSRAELEARIEQVRARRMMLAFDYHASQKIDVEQQADKTVRKFKEHGDMLGKELQRLDRALDAVENRVAKMSELQQEHGLLQDLLSV